MDEREKKKKKGSVRRRNEQKNGVGGVGGRELLSITKTFQVKEEEEEGTGGDEKH